MQTSSEFLITCLNVFGKNLMNVSRVESGIEGWEKLYFIVENSLSY